MTIEELLKEREETLGALKLVLLDLEVLWQHPRLALAHGILRERIEALEKDPPRG